MRLMIYLSLILNVLVLVPVCVGVALGLDWTREAYGEFTPARGILLSIYVAIGLLSLGLIFRPDPKMVAALLLIQIMYKLLTPLTVGSTFNPVVISNILIAVFHLITLAMVWREPNSLASAS